MNRECDGCKRNKGVKGAVYTCCCGTLKNIDIVISRIEEWQNNNKVHPLTCGTDSNHAKLRPVEKDYDVVLKCSDCDYVQTYIPKEFLKDL